LGPENSKCLALLLLQASSKRAIRINKKKSPQNNRYVMPKWEMTETNQEMEW
jgi:hypothetical protein